MRRASAQAGLGTLAEQVADLDVRITELEALPVQPARTEHVPTGRTYRDDWDADPAGRRRLLLDAAIRHQVLLERRTRTQGGSLRGKLRVTACAPPHTPSRRHRAATPR